MSLVSIVVHPTEVRAQLDRICDSPHFRTAGLIRDFLRFVVIETIEGRGRNIKEYTIGTTVYSRHRLYEPKADSIVRVEAVKLRARLNTYYALAGWADQLVISIPKGGYAPEFQNRSVSAVKGSAVTNRIAELCDIGSLALLRRTPASIDVATSCFLQARSLDLTDTRGHLGLATSYSASLDIETVSPRDVAAAFEESVLQGLRLNQNSGEAHVLNSLWPTTVGGADEKAMAQLTCALQLEPRSPVAHFWASALMSAKGAHESSLEHFRQAIRYAPDCALVRAYRGRALYYAGRYREALDVLGDVTDADPGLAVGHLWVALARTELGRHDEAIEAGAQAVRLSETSATLSTSAYVLARAGRREEAELMVKGLTANPPYGYVSPIQLAVIAEALGRIEEAAMHLASAQRENAWALLWQNVDERVKRVHRRIADG
jgi:Tfp pilus assembly protein PilF